MSETKLLNCLLTEGVLLSLLGIAILLLPKVTMISFGFILCFAFITYGGYKAINSFLTRYFSKYYIFSIVAGLLLFMAGILLLFAPFFNPLWISSILGVYFIVESITSCALASRTQDILNFRHGGYILGLLQFFFGMTIILILPSGILWLAGILAGLDFLLSGITYLNIYFATKR